MKKSDKVAEAAKAFWETTDNFPIKLEGPQGDLWDDLCEALLEYTGETVDDR